MEFKFKTLKQQYTELLASKICVSVEDLTETEMSLIENSYLLWMEKMEDIKILNDDLKRVTNELLNLKAYSDDSENDYDE